MRADLALRQLYANHQGKSSDKWEIYLDAYDELLEKHRGNIRSMLEIGVQNGGSLDIWGKYFPSCQKIVGVDIDPKVAGLEYSDERIQVLVGDAASDATLNQLREVVPQGFDLIIDDGSHRSSDIIKTFIRILPQLNSGGLYIAEDLHCSYWENWEGGLYAPHSSIAFFKLLVDIVNHQHWGIDVPRSVLIEDYLEKLGLGIEDIQLAGIVEVRFLNSLCIVKKMDPTINNLGSRVIVGSEQAVRDNSDAVRDSYSPPPQDENHWSQPSSFDFAIYRALERSREVLSVELEETKKLAHQLQLELNAAKSEIQSYSQDVQALRSSWSWRLTTPLRHIAAPIAGLRRKKNTIAEAVKLGGGVLPTVALTLQVVRKEGMDGVLHRIDLANASANGNSEQGSYADWLARNDPTDPQTLQRLAEEVGALKLQPLISVVMPVYNPPIEFLDKAIQSVRAQVYSNWELCIADDASTDEAVKAYLQELVRTDARIKVVFRSENGHISAATNSALDIAEGDFVALLDNDDELSLHALAHIVIAINRRPDVDVIFSDEDKVDPAGVRSDPYFKSEFNYELFLSQNMISHLGVYRLSAVRKVGGFQVGCEGAQDWDLAFRVLELSRFKNIIHVPRVLYHWRVFRGSTAFDLNEKPYVAAAQVKAISDHLKRLEKVFRVERAEYLKGMYRVKYDINPDVCSVSIIISGCSISSNIDKCLVSIAKYSGSVRYEVILINDDSLDHKQLSDLRSLIGCDFNVVSREEGKSCSQMKNIAVERCTGDLVCFLDGNIEIISENWLADMASFAEQERVGCVGARVWSTEGELLHAGVIMGMFGLAGPAFIGFKKGNPGYLGRAVLHQSYSALSGCCLMIKRSLFGEAGKLDEKLSGDLSAIDLCLKVKRLGYRNVWIPYPEMVSHIAERTDIGERNGGCRGAPGEIAIMRERWQSEIENDSAYSPNLSLIASDFSVADKSRITSPR